MKANDKTNFLGLPISVDYSAEQLLSSLRLQTESAQLISFVNPHAWFISQQQPDYIDHLNQLSLILVDGIGVIKALKSINNIDCTRLAFDFSSMAGPIFETCREEHLSISIVGGKTGIAKLAAKKLLRLYPGLHIESCWSGFGSDPINAITSFSDTQPAVVICGMGAPRQEEFLLQLKESGWNGTGFSCGGFLDQMIQSGSYYPEWIDKNNLRFLYRLYKEPRRLSKRYFIEYLPFIKKVVHARIIKLG